MTLPEYIRAIEKALLEGRPISEIKPLLASLREHQEALEAELQKQKEDPQKQNLEAEATAANDLIRDLSEKIDQLEEKERQKKRDAESIKGNILLYLRDNPDCYYMAIAEHFKMREDEMNLYLDDLGNDGLARVTDLDLYPNWSLTPLGLRWLADHELL